MLLLVRRLAVQELFALFGEGLRNGIMGMKRQSIFILNSYGIDVTDMMRQDWSGLCLLVRLLLLVFLGMGHWIILILQKRSKVQVIVGEETGRFGLVSVAATFGGRRVALLQCFIFMRQGGGGTLFDENTGAVGGRDGKAQDPSS